MRARRTTAPHFFLAVLGAIGVGAAQVSADADGEAAALTKGSSSVPAVTQRSDRRLFTLVPRIGAHFGTWGGNLHTDLLDWHRIAFSFDSDASGNTGVVAGAEGLFRFRWGLRVGGGVLVMPGLSFNYTFDNDGPSRKFTAGSVIRIPAVLEWEFALSRRFSIVSGFIPSGLLLMRGEQAKNRARRLCVFDCTSEDHGTGFALEGELGIMWWIDSSALRADLRFGSENLDTVSIANEPSIRETLSGLRLTFLLGFEI